MVINWYGEGCFKIQEGPLTLIVDPFESSTGLTPPRHKPTILVRTIMPNISQKTNKPISTTEKDTNIIGGPGEFEIQGIVVKGYPLVKDSSVDFLKSIYKVEFGKDGITLGFLGHISDFSEPEIFSELGDIDILFIPGGNAPFIKQDKAAKLIRQIEPKIVIPGFFKVPRLKRKANAVDDFLKEIGQDSKPEEKLNIKKKDLPEKMKVVVLKKT